MINARLFALSIICLTVCLFLKTNVVAEVNSMDGTRLYAHHMQDTQGMTVMPFTKPEGPVVTFKTDPSSITAGVPGTITVSITDADAKPIQELGITHERVLHVIIASKDFTIFSHIHPEDFGPITPAMKKAAQYPVRYIFPKAGSYIVGVDFAVKDQSYSRHFEVDVTGEPKIGSAESDFSRQKKFGDYEVTLTAKPEIITAGKEVTLSYQIKKNGVPVTDLEPYLSAYMHAALISTDFKYFMHEHGMAPGMAEHEHHMMMHDMRVPEKFGPVIELNVTFPAPGVYEVFGEVKHQGKVIVTKFMVEVK